MPRFKFTPRQEGEQPPQPSFFEAFDKAAGEFAGGDQAEQAETKAKRMGRPFYEPEPWQFKMVERMAGLGMIQLDICYIIGISENTFRIYFTECWQLGKAKAKGIAGGMLWKHIMSGNFPALQFYMRTQMGWVEKRSDDPDAPDAAIEAMDDDDIRREIAVLDENAATVSQARALATRVSR